jgi:rifampin ADP-ribosylating transferase
MNHIYFTALPDGAGLVEPTGAFEDDPNVTDKRFPGNPMRSYRSREPLKVLAEVADWTRQTPDALEEWGDRLAATRVDQRGDNIN